MMDLVDRDYQFVLQSNGALPAPIKEFTVERVHGTLYKGFMILEDGSKILCNTGSIGQNIGKQSPEEWFKKAIEKQWTSRKNNFGVLVG